MTSQDDAQRGNDRMTIIAIPTLETFCAGIVTALTGLNGAWLSTGARYLLGMEAIAVLAAGTIVTGALAARHLRHALTAAPGRAMTCCTAAVFIALIALGAWIGRTHALEMLDQFYR